MLCPLISILMTAAPYFYMDELFKYCTQPSGQFLCDTRVLIVEDDLITRTLLEAIITEMGCTVIEAENGEDAQEKLSNAKPDLILLDIIMPGMDGYELCRLLKADSATAGISIIFLSAMTDEKDEAKGFNVGAVDYIFKPIRPTTVKARVRTHLELKRHRDNLEELVTARTRELEEAVANIRSLKGLLPICASCKKIRDDSGYWNKIEVYIETHSEAEFTHGICPDCARRLNPELYDDI